MSKLYEESTFLSAGRCARIHMRLYEPACRPVAILQVVHGMAEHMGRYDTFARRMCKAGFVVCLHDHAGHGLSIGEGPPGYFAPRRGDRVLMDDTLSCGSRARARHKKLPFILMGHSMGSFVVRCLAARNSACANAFIFMGTGAATAAAVGGLTLAELDCLTGSAGRPNILLDQAMNRANLAGISSPQTPHDWLSYSTRNTEAYMQDPCCGFTFTTAGFRDLFRLLLTANAPATIDRTNKAAPILFISGADDPVGDCGRGVRRIYDAYRRAGCRRTTLALLPGMRHEVLNEDNSEPVYDTILYWAARAVPTKEAP